jgi:protein involved in polysaccharide export with SLBB domain
MINDEHMSYLAEEIEDALALARGARDSLDIVIKRLERVIPKRQDPLEALQEEQGVVVETMGGGKQVVGG